MIAAPRRLRMHRRGDAAHDVVAAHDRRHDFAARCCRAARATASTAGKITPDGCAEPCVWPSSKSRPCVFAPVTSAAFGADSFAPLPITLEIRVASFSSKYASNACDTGIAAPEIAQVRKSSIVRLNACTVSAGSLSNVRLAACAGESRARADADVVGRRIHVHASLPCRLLCRAPALRRLVPHHQTIDRDHAAALRLARSAD